MKTTSIYLFAIALVLPYRMGLSFEDTGWLSQYQYQSAFDIHVANGFYPRIVEGRQGTVAPQYRGIFGPNPSGEFNFAAAHSIDDDEFNTRNKNYSKEGFKLISHQTFVDGYGLTRHQAVWVFVGYDFLPWYEDGVLNIPHVAVSTGFGGWVVFKSTLIVKPFSEPLEFTLTSADPK